MKIALIGRYGDGEIVAGPERVAREIYHEFKQKNINADFIEYFFTGYTDYSVIKKIVGKKLVENNFYRLGIIPLIIKLFREKYDAIHFINSQRFQLPIFILKPIFKSKIISTLHGLYKIESTERKKSFKKRYFLDQLVEKFIIKKSDLVIFPSYLLLTEFKKDYKFALSKFIVIPNGIGKQFFNSEPKSTFKQDFNLIFYNSFDGLLNKGLNELVKQLCSITDFKIRLFVLGHVQRELYTNINLEIVFVGTLSHSDLIKFCMDKSFIIKSDAFDTFSIIIGESMALGVIPIITTNVGFKDYIKNGINGFIYDSNSPNSLVDLLNEISENNYDIDSISENAKKIVKELSWQFIGDKYIQAYKSLL